MSKIEQPINGHPILDPFTWLVNVIVQPRTGEGSSPANGEHFQANLDEIRSKLVERIDVANRLDVTESNKVLDARQAGVLVELINEMTSLVWQVQVEDEKATPTEGRFIVADGATGDWAGHEGEIVDWDGEWQFTTPENGWAIYLEDRGELWAYHDGWRVMANLGKIRDYLLQTEQARDDVLLDSGFQAVAGDLTGSNKIGNVSDHIEDVIQTAAIHEDIGSVAGIAQDVTDIAGIKADVTAVSGIKADVTSVSGIKADVSKVATIDSDVSNVASIKQNVTDVAGIKTDVTDVANIKADVSGVADIKVAVSGVNANKSNINTVAGNNVNVSTVAANIGNVNKVGAIDTNVTKVANIDSDVTKVASIDTAVANVSSIKDNVVAVDGNKANINAVHANKNNIDKVANINNDVTKVANIDTDVSAVALIDDDVTDVALIKQDVTDVAGIKVEVEDVADIKNTIVAVDANKTNINAVNANKTNIDKVAETKVNIDAVALNKPNIDAVALNKVNIDKVATVDAQITTLAPIKDDIITVAGKKTEVTALGARTTEIDALYAQLPAITEKESIANVDALKGTGWTDETVKGNADAIALRELLSNKKTTLADNSDTYFPTQKAVNEGLNQTMAEIMGFAPRNLMTVFGTATVAETFAELRARAITGDFSTLRLGDYIDLPSLTIGADSVNPTVYPARTINNDYNRLRVEIVGFDDYLNVGSTPVPTVHHVTMMFKDIPTTAPFNETNITTGDYKGSMLFHWLHERFEPALISAIGLTPRPVDRRIGTVADWGWVGSETIFLPTNVNVFGTTGFSHTDRGTGTQTQFALFAMNPNKKIKKNNGSRAHWWLAEPSANSSTYFCRANDNGTAYNVVASITSGVVPAFLI